MTVSIAGLDKAAVLAAAYNASKQQGMGFLHARGATGMTVDQARAELEHGLVFDYLHGRVMKLNLVTDDVNEWGYDRDNGAGAFAAAVEPLRAVEDDDE